MRILYPANPVNSKEADEPYQEEFSILRARGADCSLFDFDAIELNELKPRPGISTGDEVLYRGWMLDSDRYRKLAALVEARGGAPFTSHEQYLRCHHLPNWYESCAEFTAESVFFAFDEKLVDNVERLGWEQFFVKDFVKSNTTARGSIAATPGEVRDIAELIAKYRGEIEGGIAVRRVEQYDDATEVRYFVFNGKAYAPDSTVPDIVSSIAARVDAGFFSVDIIRRSDGELRLDEVGDGQVSDKKSWSESAFADMLLDNV